MKSNGNGIGGEDRERRVIILAQELFLRRATDVDLEPLDAEGVYDSMHDEALNSLVAATAFFDSVESWTKAGPKKRGTK